MSLIQLTYNDEYFEYHGFVTLGDREVAIHFPLYEPIAECDLLAKHEKLVTLVLSRSQWLIEQAVQLNQPRNDLPSATALIIYPDGIFELQFGSSGANDKLWCEASYQNDGVAYHYERHLPAAVAPRD